MTFLKNDGGWSLTPDPKVKRWYVWLALAYLILAIYGSFVPFHFRWLSGEVALERWRQVLSVGPKIQSRTDVAANVLLFIPLAFLWMGALCVNRSRRFGFLMGLILVPVCFLLSSSIEFAQLYFPRRTSSIS